MAHESLIGLFVGQIWLSLFSFISDIIRTYILQWPVCPGERSWCAMGSSAGNFRAHHPGWPAVFVSWCWKGCTRLLYWIATFQSCWELYVTSVASAFGKCPVSSWVLRDCREDVDRCHTCCSGGSTWVWRWLVLAGMSGWSPCVGSSTALFESPQMWDFCPWTVSKLLIVQWFPCCHLLLLLNGF